MKHDTLMRYGLVAGAALVVGLLVAGTSWRSLLPLALLLACPLIMVFMMRDMGEHGGHGTGPERPEDAHRQADRDESDAGRRL
jgi:Protein of unknown function (DUF2933)